MAFMGIFLTMPLLVLLLPIVLPVMLITSGWGMMQELFKMGPQGILDALPGMWETLRQWFAGLF